MIIRKTTKLNKEKKKKILKPQNKLKNLTQIKTLIITI